MPIAIIGSGRCGSSMIAQMLRICGLYIGEEADMNWPGDQDNPTGYWEHADFFRIDERILAHFGCTAESPKIFPLGWEDDPGLAPLYDEARAMVEKLFGGRNAWGWKDPRTSTTIPFWKRVVPDLRFVLVVRNPVDVAESLRRHYEGHGRPDFAHDTHAFLDWYFYNASALAATLPNERIVTFYEDYFPDYRKALAPVLKFAGLPAVEDGSEIDRALRELHDPGLRHHFSTPEDVAESTRAPEIVRRLYAQIRAGQAAGGATPAIVAENTTVLPLVALALSAERAAAQHRWREEQGLKLIVRERVRMLTIRLAPRTRLRRCLKLAGIENGWTRRYDAHVADAEERERIYKMQHADDGA